MLLKQETHKVYEVERRNDLDKTVSINIKSTQTADNEKDTTELFTYGKMSRSADANSYQISYDESEATGFSGHKITLDIKGEHLVSMMRQGPAASNLIIEQGKKHHCHYSTPYGDFMVGITGNMIKANLNDHGGNIYLKYTIDINSSLMSENELQIDIKEC